MRHFVIVLALGLAAAARVSATETITVTAYRTAQPLDRIGSATTIVPREAIETRQAAVAADALRWVPGLAVARSGPIGAQTQVRIRGAEANQALVLIDGIEANDLATDDSFSFEHLTTFDIERIEVVRGPQSALWGSDALAGVINIVTRRPESPRETSGYLEGGSFGLVNGGARTGLRSDRATVAASASRFQADGTNAANAGSEDDGYDNTSGMAAGTFAVTPAITLDATVRHTDATTEYDALDFVDGALAAVDADNETDVEHTFARAGGRLELADGRLIQDLHYAVTATETETTAQSSFDSSVDRSSTDGDKYGVYYQGTIRLPSKGDDSPVDQLTVAVDHERQEFSQRGEPSFFGDPNQDQRLSTTGYAVEYLAFVGDLAVSASARHDDNSDFDDVNTWRATASWALPATDSRLHASVGTGQKAPTFFERFGYAPDSFVGNPDLEPETSTGWDAGIEQRWLAGTVVADITYFQADLDDEINGFFCPPPTFACTAVNEPGESERRGVEATLEAALAEHFSLSAAYTYTDATQETSTGGDEREVRRPLHAASLNLTGRWLDRRLVVNVGAAYTGERKDFAFLLDPPYIARVDLDDYTLVSLAASYAVTKQLTVYGRIDNALDTDYEDVYGFNTPGAGAFLGMRMTMAQ
jgi:vitamin B12 transporter